MENGKIRRKIEDRLRKDVGFLTEVEGIFSAGKPAGYPLNERETEEVIAFCQEKWGVTPRILVAGFMGHLGDGVQYRKGVLVGITLTKTSGEWEFHFELQKDFYAGGTASSGWLIKQGGYNPAR